LIAGNSARTAAPGHIPTFEGGMEISGTRI
jgi:hypothetical protein